MAATGERPGVSPCLQWLKEKGFFRRSKERQATFTHTLFNGGLLDIPDEYYEEFIKKLATDMDHGNPYYVNEIASEVTAVYMDCDFIDVRPEESSNQFNDFIKDVVETDLREQSKEFDRQIAAVNAQETLKKSSSMTNTSLSGGGGGGNGSSNGNNSAGLTRQLSLPPILVQSATATDASSSSATQQEEKEEKSKSNSKKSKSVDVILEEVGAKMPRNYVFKFIYALQKCIYDYYKESVPDRDDPRYTCILLSTAKDKFGVEVKKYWDAKMGAMVRTHRIMQRKCGLHIIWPWLYATQNDMLDLREGFLRAVGHECGDRSQKNNSWAQVIDQKIYLPMPSLRMVNCDKVEECPNCKRSSTWRIDCANCHGAPPASGRVYRPEFSFNGRGTLTSHAKECLENTEYMLRLCSIRRPGLTAQDIHDPERAKAVCPGGVPVFKVPDTAPRYDGVRHAYKKPINGEKKDKAKEDAEKSLQIQETKGLSEFNKRRLVRQLEPGSKLLHDIEQFLHSSSMPSHYRQVIVSSVLEFSINDNHYYAVRVTGEGSKFCQNVDREHNSVRVYFHFTRSKGCQQRCFCRCVQAKPGHITPAVLCKDFASIGVPLPRILELALFPKEMAILDREQEREQQGPALIAVNSHADASYMFKTVDIRRTGEDEESVVNLLGTRGFIGKEEKEEDEEEDKRPLKRGTEFEFDAVDPDCIGVQSRSVVAMQGEPNVSEEQKRTRRIYAGDNSVLSRPTPSGKHWIPRDGTHAPGTEEEARQMLLEATKKEFRQKNTRERHALHELFSGDYDGSTI